MYIVQFIIYLYIMYVCIIYVFIIFIYMYMCFSNKIKLNTTSHYVLCSRFTYLRTIKVEYLAFE